MAMKRALPWIIAAALAAAGVAGWLAVRNGAKPEKYLTATVARGDLEDAVSALGSLQPFEYVDVGTQVTGQLKALHVAIGDAVKQGDLIAEIDPTLFNARVEESRATLKLLQAQLGERAAQERLAQEVHARNKLLFANHAASEEALQQSRAAEEQAAAQVEAVRAQLEEAKSRLSADEANLRYTKIFAPISGTVVSHTARQGQTLVASQQAPTILRIADLRTMTVWAQVSEADVPKVRVEMPAYFNTLGLPERRWLGKVRQVMPTPETVNNVVLYNVLFDVDNPDQVLKPQMSAQVYFVVGRAENVLLVPAAALQPAARDKAAPAPDGAREKPAKREGTAGKERTYSVRLLRGGVVEERAVTVGLATRLTAEVLSGLAEGETVIVGIESDASDRGRARELPRPGRP